jgi:transposase
MLALAGNAKLYFYQGSISMQNSFEGLSAEIEKIFPSEITSGAYFIFLNKTRDRMKVLYWDSDGLAIWYKRLEKGSFSSKLLEGKRSIERREFLMLLEGITPKRLQSRYKLL